MVFSFDVSTARLKALLPWFAILGAAMLFFLPVVVEGTTFYAFDILGDYWPWRGTGQLPLPKNPLLTDPIVGLYPPTFYFGHAHYQTALARGELAFWEPAILGGQPYQHYLSPVHYLLFSLLPLTVAHDVLLCAGLCLVGTFTLLYLRSVGLGVLASLFGALAFMLNGYLMVWFEFEHILALSAGLAGALYFSERLLTSRSWTAALALALCLSAGIAIAHPQQSIYLGGFVVCYFGYRVWARRRAGDDGATARLLVRFAVALGTTAVLSLGYLLGSLDQILDSGRSAIPFSQLFRQTGALPASYLATLLFPDYYGSPVLGWATTPKPLLPQPYNNYSELCIYAGVPTLLLALMSLTLRRQQGLPRFFGVTAIVCLLFAGGTLLYYPVAKLVPGMSLSTPCRVLFLLGFSLAALAALALHRLLTDPAAARERRVRLIVPALLALLVAAVVIVLWVPGGPAWLWRQTMGSAGLEHADRISQHFAVTGSAFGRALPIIAASVLLAIGLVLARARGWRSLAAAALLVLLFVDLVGFGWRYNTRSPRAMAYPSTGAIERLRRDPDKFRVMTLDPFFLSNALMAFGIEDAGGYRSFYPRAYGEYWYISQHDGGEIPAEFPRWCGFRAIGSPLLDALNVKYVLLPRAATMPEQRFRLVYAGESYVYENLRAFPRAFLVRDAEVLADATARLASLRKSSREQLARRVILEKEVARPEAPPDARDGEPRPVQIVRYRPDEVELRVDDDRGGFVVMGDNYHPGWRAWVDGRPTEILRANHIMRAVPVGPGAHTIEMRFQAPAQLGGLLVSNLGWLLVLAVVVGVRIRRPRDEQLVAPTTA